MGLGQSWLLSNHVAVQCWEMVHRLSHQPQLYLGSRVRHPPQSLAIDIHLYTFTVMRKTAISTYSHRASTHVFPLTHAFMLRWLPSLFMILFGQTRLGSRLLLLVFGVKEPLQHIMCCAMHVCGTGKYAQFWQVGRCSSGFKTASAAFLLVRLR